MIKFIAVDMDGTLLDSDKNLPPRFTENIKKLNDMGIVFAPASGRQYYSLKCQFEELDLDFIYIAENGAIVVEDGEIVSMDCLDGDVAKDIISKVRNISTASIILCCEDYSYSEKIVGDHFIKNAQMYYKKFKLVDDLIPLCDTKSILKIAIFDPISPDKNVKQVLPSYDGLAEIIVSGDEWVDAMKPGVSKGSAIKRIKEKYGFKSSECMCFGDYMNDYKMLLECDESYAMKNAHEELKKIAKYIAPSNDENGVMRVIEEKFNL